MKRTVAFILMICLCLPQLFSCGSPLVLETAASAESAETGAPDNGAESAETGESAPARSVRAPLTERPNFVLREGATADEMREMAIKAMRVDMSFCWYPDKEVEYSYVSPNTGEEVVFRLYPDRTYAGIPYSSSYTGLFQMLEYYDFSTGRISVPNRDLFTTLVGNDCAGGILWALAACVPSFEPSGNGFGIKGRSDTIVPVGPYAVPDPEEEKSTNNICKLNGEQTMYESYAQLKPADVVYTGQNPGLAGHYQMLLEEPEVVRLPDGSIDGKNSVITIQDQMRGQRTNVAEYVKEEDGETRYYSGRWNVKVSFDSLFTGGYLPVTCLEFLGERPYVTPSVSPDRELTTLDELNEARLKSQYMICAFHIRLLDENGEAVYTRNKATSYGEMTSGKLKDYPLKDLLINSAALSRSVNSKGNYTLAIDCVDATGSAFEVVRLPVAL